MADQRTLLAAYANQRSETAFRELVGNYVDLVYSTAMRVVNGDIHLAQDVTQIVFTDLARLAATLSPHVMLGGWLHRRTWYVAANLMRKERRRQYRERQAAQMNTPSVSAESPLNQIAPLLDDAINQLSGKDRFAILLRFFEHRDFRAVGMAMGTNEDAAQKRVHRAVEKLRRHFSRRGVCLSATLLSSMLISHAVQAAPSALAPQVSAVSLAAAASSPSSATLIKLFLMKKTVCVLAGMFAATAVLLPLVLAQTTASTTLKDGLVMHLTFDQPEISGPLVDASGHHNSGWVTGAHWSAQGKSGGAYEFNADGEQIVISNNASLNPKQLTLSAWIKTSTADHFWRRIFDKSYAKGFALGIAGDWNETKWRGLLSMEISGHAAQLSKRIVTDGQWHHVVVSYDGHQQQLYVDGEIQAKALTWTGETPSNDFDLVIGCNRSNLHDEDLGTSFRGLIDEPMLWNRALSAEEVKALFALQNKG